MLWPRKCLSNSANQSMTIISLSHQPWEEVNDIFVLSKFSMQDTRRHRSQGYLYYQRVYQLLEKKPEWGDGLYDLIYH